MINVLQAFETLIRTVCVSLCAIVQPHLNYPSVSCLLQNLDIRMPFISLTLLDPCTMMGEWRYQWGCCWNVLPLSTLVVCKHRLCNALLYS